MCLHKAPIQHSNPNDISLKKKQNTTPQFISLQMAELSFKNQLISLTGWCRAELQGRALLAKSYSSLRIICKFSLLSKTPPSHRHSRLLSLNWSPVATMRSSWIHSSGCTGYILQAQGTCGGCACNGSGQSEEH